MSPMVFRLQTWSLLKRLWKNLRYKVLVKNLDSLVVTTNMLMNLSCADVKGTKDEMV